MNEREREREREEKEHKDENQLFYSFIVGLSLNRDEHSRVNP